MVSCYQHCRKCRTERIFKPVQGELKLICISCGFIHKFTEKAIDLPKAKLEVKQPKKIGHSIEL